MLETYDEVLDIAESYGLFVVENVPFEGNTRGMIFGNQILISDRIHTTNEKRAVAIEEITHFEVSSGNIVKNNKEELKAHKKMTTERITVFELLDAVIDLGYNANYYTVANKLEIPEWFLKEAIESYSNLPLRPFEYRNCIVTFNPFSVINKEELE